MGGPHEKRRRQAFVDWVRQAAKRLGVESAAGVSQAVERIGDPEGLAAAGEWIVRADRGDELVARLTQLAEERDAR